MLFFAHAVIYENVCMLYAIRYRAPYNYIFIVIKLHCYRSSYIYMCAIIANKWWIEMDMTKAPPFAFDQWGRGRRVTSCKRQIRYSWTYLSHLMISCLCFYSTFLLNIYFLMHVSISSSVYWVGGVYETFANLNTFCRHLLLMFQWVRVKLIVRGCMWHGVVKTLQTFLMNIQWIHSSLIVIN